MSEEEIINYLKELTKPPLRPEWDFAYKLDKKTADIIQGLLDLYQKEKQKNIDLTQELEERKWVKINENGEVEPAFYISKAKIQELLEKYANESFIPKVEVQELLKEV